MAQPRSFHLQHRKGIQRKVLGAKLVGRLPLSSMISVGPHRNGFTWRRMSHLVSSGSLAHYWERLSHREVCLIEAGVIQRKSLSAPYIERLRERHLEALLSRAP